MEKKILLSVCFIWVCFGVFAQGVKVLYEDRIVIDEESIKTDNPELTALLKARLGGMKKGMVLYYQNGESLYETFQQEEAEAPMESQGMNIVIKSSGGDGAVYKNRKEKKCVSQEYIQDRKFLIRDTLRDFTWTLEDGEKVILGYPCKKATDQSGVIVWYTLEIPVNEGPFLFNGLPGLILEVEMTQKIITATEITLNTDVSEKIKEPVSGKKIKREEFNKQQAKRIEEMKRENPEGKVNIKIMNE